MNKITRNVSRDKILEEISRHIEAAKGMINVDISSTVVKIGCAQSLIELLESEDCGSWGGYDSRDPQCGNHGFNTNCIKNIESRYKWLKSLGQKADKETK